MRTAVKPFSSSVPLGAVSFASMIVSEHIQRKRQFPAESASSVSFCLDNKRSSGVPLFLSSQGENSRANFVWTSSMLHVRVLEATGIAPAPNSPYCHPYIRVSDGHSSVCTRAVDDFVNPHWDQTLRFRLVDRNFTGILFVVLNSNPFGSDEELASCSVSADRLAIGALIDEWFTFIGTPEPRVHIRLHRPNRADTPFLDPAVPRRPIEVVSGPQPVFSGSSGDFGPPPMSLFGRICAQRPHPGQGLLAARNAQISDPGAASVSHMAAALQQFALGLENERHSDDDFEEEEEEEIGMFGHSDDFEEEEDEEESDTDEVVELSREEAIARRRAE
jgi:hypothetical protein